MLRLVLVLLLLCFWWVVKLYSITMCVYYQPHGNDWDDTDDDDDDDATYP